MGNNPLTSIIENISKIASGIEAGDVSVFGGEAQSAFDKMTPEQKDEFKMKLKASPEVNDALTELKNKMNDLKNNTSKQNAAN
jgi:hypothetical protein